MSSAKPLKSFKNSSDIVLKQKLALTAVSSGVLRRVELATSYHSFQPEDQQPMTCRPYPVNYQLLYIMFSGNTPMYL